MKTILFHPERDADAIPQAAAILRRGGLLGIPTETVYGLGADALNETAVRHIFEAKGRPQDNPSSSTCRMPRGWSGTAGRYRRRPTVWRSGSGRGR